MRLRDVAVAAAAAVAALGIASVFVPAVPLPDDLGTQSRVLLALAGVAWGLWILRRWIGAEPGGYRPPERERLAPVETPGADLDELLPLGAGTGETARYYRSRVRDRLQAIAVRVLTTHAGLAPEEARRRLREGTWTDDPAAARYFQLSGDVTGGAIGVRPGFEHPQTRRARHAVGELRAIAEGDG